MIPVRIKCPHCGADVKADTEKEQVVCNFCGQTIPLDEETIRGGIRLDSKDVPMVERIRDYKEGEEEERKIVVLRRVTMILANLTAILSANYLVFYILGSFMPNLHFVVRSEFLLARYLHYLIPILTLTTAFLYLLLLVVNGFSRRKLKLKRFLMLLAADIFVAGVLAVSINAYTFDWFHSVKRVDDALEEAEVQDIDVGSFKDKFTDGEVKINEPNTVETLEDGTERTLIYTYASGKVAVDIYHYQKEDLEYQIADVYVRDIDSLRANYTDTQGEKELTTPEFAQEIKAIAAINSDHFEKRDKREGLIVRNRNKIYDQPCKYSDLCVIYQDGTVRCFEYNKDYSKDNPFDNEEILSSHPYHTFYFGPSLLDADGNAKVDFNSAPGISSDNPRSVFGYYAPGHYAFLCVLGDRAMKDAEGRSLGDGRSPGMTLQELSELCANLGMKAAYNLEGGNASALYWNETVYGHNNSVTSDILAVIDE